MASGAKNDVTLTNEMVSGFDSSKAGVNTVTITYEGNTITVDLTIEEKPATGCGGSVIASLFGLVALAGSVVLLRKKREE